MLCKETQVIGRYPSEGGVIIISEAQNHQQLYSKLFSLDPTITDRISEILEWANALPAGTATSSGCTNS